MGEKLTLKDISPAIMIFSDRLGRIGNQQQ